MHATHANTSITIRMPEPPGRLTALTSLACTSPQYTAFVRRTTARGVSIRRVCHLNPLHNSAPISYHHSMRLGCNPAPPPPSHAHRCRCPKSVRHTRAPAVRTYLAHLPAASCPCPRPHEHADVSTECHSTPSIPHASPPHSRSPLTSAPSRRALADPPCSLRLRGVRTRRPACPPP